MSKAQFAPGDLQPLVGPPPALPARLCGLGTRRVSPALSAELLACSPHRSEAPQGCSTASWIVWAIFHLSPAPTGTGLVLECPWTWSLLPSSNDAFTMGFRQLGVKPCANLHLIKSIFLFFLFQLSFACCFSLFVCIKNMQQKGSV